MSSEIAIRVSNLSKCYQLYDKPQHRLLQGLFRGRKQFFREFWALRDVSFEVKKGETVGIIGRNGSGKSTLLQMICGTLTPTSGDVDVKGRVAALLELGAGFNPEFTGRENVYMNAAILGMTQNDIDARFDDIASFADIGAFIEQPVKTYSSGMYVRLAFAISVSVLPDIFVVDEALAVGDARFQMKCIDRINKLKENGATILFVSHAVEQIKRLCSRALWLHGGRIRALGHAPHVCDQYESFDDDRVIADAHRRVDHNAASGSPVAKITSVEINRIAFRPFETLRVDLEYEVFEDAIESLLIGVAIRRQSDDCYVFGPNTALDKVSIPNTRGKHKTVYEVPSLPLLGGAYYIDAGLFSDKGLVCLYYEPKARHFEVKADYFAEGLIHMDHKWSFPA